MSENNKTKTITVSLTDKEVDTLEDMLWRKVSKDQLIVNFPYRSTLWYKILHEFVKKEGEKE